MTNLITNIYMDMKITDVSPIFLANVQHKVLCWDGHDQLQVVKLECINPTKQLVKGEVYWAYEDTSSNYWYSEPGVGYPVYRIFLPILGCRKYDSKRFKILDTLVISKTDFKNN